MEGKAGHSQAAQGGVKPSLNSSVERRMHLVSSSGGVTGDAVGGFVGGAVGQAVGYPVGVVVSQFAGDTQGQLMSKSIGDFVGNAVSGAVGGAVDGLVENLGMTDSVEKLVGEFASEVHTFANEIQHKPIEAIGDAVNTAVDMADAVDNIADSSIPENHLVANETQHKAIDVIGDAVERTVGVTDAEDKIAGSSISENRTVANEDQHKAIESIGDAVDKTVGVGDAEDKHADSSIPGNHTIANETQHEGMEPISDVVDETVESGASVISVAKASPQHGSTQTWCNPPRIRDSTGVAIQKSRQGMTDIATPSSWISEKSLHEKYKDDVIAMKLQDGSIQKRQNPDCPERTQYHEILPEVADTIDTNNSSKNQAEILASVPLSEEGYQKVAALKDDEAMLIFVRRQLDALGMRARSQDELRGWVGWFSGTLEVQSHAAMMRELRTQEWLIPNESWGPYSSEALKT